jgi:hypothetical protein
MSVAGTYEKERDFSTRQVLMANQAIGECWTHVLRTILLRAIYRTLEWDQMESLPRSDRRTVGPVQF